MQIACTSIRDESPGYDAIKHKKHLTLRIERDVKSASLFSLLEQFCLIIRKPDRLASRSQHELAMKQNYTR